MGKVEELFAAGVAAFEAGEPRIESREFDWKCGWDSALEAKVQTFAEYRKTRTLHDQEYMPPSWPRSRLPATQASRLRLMTRWVEWYPDFPDAYEKWKADR